VGAIYTVERNIGCFYYLGFEGTGSDTGRLAEKGITLGDELPTLRKPLGRWFKTVSVLDLSPLGRYVRYKNRLLAREEGILSGRSSY